MKVLVVTADPMLEREIRLALLSALAMLRAQQAARAFRRAVRICRRRP